MKCAHGLATTLTLVLIAAESHAQGIANANPAVRGSDPAALAPRSGRLRLPLYYGDPFGFGFSYSYSQVTVLRPYRPPTVVVVIPRGESQASERDGERDDQPPPGVIRIRPRREREREKEKQEQAKEKEKAEEPIAAPQPKAEPIPPPRPLEPPIPPEPRSPLPPPPRVEPKKDPLEESARQMDVGKEAFAAGAYGRAAFRFRKAAEVAPDSALPHFLLAQALLALGNYRDAVDAIRAGMALDPTWPTSGVRPRDLYGEFVADYAEHLQQLGAALAQHPDDPVLLFLQGYVLWFDGRQDDARPLFEKAAPLVPDRKDIDRFLRQ